MLLNGSALNAAPLNGSAGPPTWYMTASFACVQGWTASMSYGIRLSALAGQLQVVQGANAALLSAQVRMQEGVTGVPWALLSAGVAMQATLTPNLWAWMSPCTIQRVMTVQGVNSAQLIATFAGQAAVTGTMGVSLMLSAQFLMVQSATVYFTGFFAAQFSMNQSVTPVPTMQWFPTATFQRVQSITAVPYAQLVATFGLVGAVAGGFNVWIWPTATFAQAQGLIGTPCALLTATVQVVEQVVGNMNVTIFKTAIVARNQSVIGYLYKQIPLYSFQAMSWGMKCNLSLLGSGKKISGKITMDVQKPYLDAKVS